MRVQLPDQREEMVYSPSTIIKEYFKQASIMSLDEFQSSCSKALQHASNRVYERFGYECSSAMGELARVNSLVEQIRAQAGADTELRVKILSI